MAKTEGKPGMNYKDNAARAEMSTVDPTAEAMAALGGATGMTRTQTAYQTAVTVIRPRSMTEVIETVCHEAGEMGEDFLYSWRQKVKPGSEEDEGDGMTTIEGMSIDGAMCVYTNYGNCALPTEIRLETPTHYYFEATFIDLEKGITLPRLFRQRKAGGPGGKMSDDRKEDIAFQIGQSKAQRNCIDKALPRLRDLATAAAKSGAAKKYADVVKWGPMMVQGFAGLGVTQEQLEKRLKKPFREFEQIIWTPHDILRLVLIARSIKSGDRRVEEEFPTPESQPGDGAASAQGTTGGSGPGDSTPEKKEPEGKSEPSPFDDLPPEASKTTTAATTTAEKKPGDAPTQQSTTPSSVEDVRAKLAGQQVKS